VLFFESSQQPTCPQERQSLRCTPSSASSFCGSDRVVKSRHAITVTSRVSRKRLNLIVCMTSRFFTARRRSEAVRIANPEQAHMLKVHHLNNSRSQRILWLMEELGLPYESVVQQRDSDDAAVAGLALRSPSARQRPDGGLRWRGPRGIGRHPIDYATRKLAGGRLAASEDSPHFASYLFWLHYAEGSAMGPVVFDLLDGMTGSACGDVLRGFYLAEGARSQDYMEGILAEQDHVVACGFTAADVNMTADLEPANLAARRDTGAPSCALCYQIRATQRPGWASSQLVPPQQQLLLGRVALCRVPLVLGLGSCDRKQFLALDSGGGQRDDECVRIPASGFRGFIAHVGYVDRRGATRIEAVYEFRSRWCRLEAVRSNGSRMRLPRSQARVSNRCSLFPDVMRLPSRGCRSQSETAIRSNITPMTRITLTCRQRCSGPRHRRCSSI
jgi:glutathione S-transferase